MTYGALFLLKPPVGFLNLIFFLACLCLDAAGAQGLQVTAGADFDFVGTGLVGVVAKSAKSEADAGSGEGMFDLDVDVSHACRGRLRTKCSKVVWTSVRLHCTRLPNHGAGKPKKKEPEKCMNWDEFVSVYCFLIRSTKLEMLQCTLHTGTQV